MQSADVESSTSYATPTEAAATFVDGWSADGEPIPADAELIQLEGSESYLHRIAVRVDGRTVAILGVEGEPGNWSVGGYTQC